LKLKGIDNHLQLINWKKNCSSLQDPPHVGLKGYHSSSNENGRILDYPIVSLSFSTVNGTLKYDRSTAPTERQFMAIYHRKLYKTTVGTIAFCRLGHFNHRHEYIQRLINRLLVFLRINLFLCSVVISI